MTKQEEHRSGTVTVSGVGEIKARPDTAWIHLGVTTRGQTAVAAVAENAERMNAVIASLRQLGIAEDALETGGVSVYPIIDYDEGPTKGQIIGFGAENQLTARTAVDRAGAAFDAAIAAGANQSSNMSFGLANDAPLRERALELAVRSGHREAQLVAGSAGVHLGGPRSIEIVYGGGRSIYLTEARAKSSTSTPVLPGLITVTAQVNMVFDSRY